MPTRKKTIIVDSPPLEPIEPIEPSKPPVETFTFKATHFYAVLVVLAFAVGVLVGYFAWGRTPAQPAGPVAGATAAPQYVRYKVPTDGFPSLGPSNAPITIVEFGDFQCPYCRRWYQQTYQPLMAAYPGKIRLVYRDSPLTEMHPNAFPAAEAAQCANEQNAFWPYHNKLYSSENDKAISSENLGDDIYKQYAQDLSLDMTKFNNCLTNHTYQKYVQDNSDFAAKTGVDSTPTFFINGLVIIGAQPIDAFKQVIDKELAHEIP